MNERIAPRPVRRELPAWLRSRWFWRSAAAVSLGLVFASYLRPQLMFDLATYVWSCF